MKHSRLKFQLQEEDKFRATEIPIKYFTTTMNVENSYADWMNTCKFDKVVKPLLQNPDVNEAQQKQYKQIKGKQ